MKKHLIIIFNVMLLAMAQQDCPNGEDYSPCTCLPDLEIQCDRVKASVIQDVFSRTSAIDLNRFEMTQSPEENVIPADLLGNKRFRTIVLLCPADDHTPKIDSRALLSSAEHTTGLWIDGCDLTLFDFTFLTGFDRLEDLRIYWSSNVHRAEWANQPILPSLSQLTINNCPGLNDWTRFPLLAKGLNGFYLHGALDVQDEAMDRILNWILRSLDTDVTLRNLDISGNALTRIPRAIASFRSLVDIDISNNYASQIKSIPAGSFAFSPDVPMQYLYLSSNQVNSIEPGAFEGDFSQATLSLSNNNLTRFEASVYQSILEQMVAANQNGYLLVSRNPFNCSEQEICNLAWLIRDNPALLAPLVESAQCDNGTFFSQLDPNGFNHCLLGA